MVKKFTQMLTGIPVKFGKKLSAPANYLEVKSKFEIFRISRIGLKISWNTVFSCFWKTCRQCDFFQINKRTSCFSKSWKFWKKYVFLCAPDSVIQVFQKTKSLYLHLISFIKTRENQEISDFDELYTVWFNFPRNLCFFLRTLLYPPFAMKKSRFFSFLQVFYTRVGTNP